MDNINDLLDKYFRAETSLMEEFQLKQYFNSNNIAEEHKKYCSLFVFFEVESTISLPTNRSYFNNNTQISSTNYWFRWLSIAGIAATFIWGLWLLQLKTTDDYAVVKGKRINDAIYAQQLANHKINKVNDILSRTFQPVQHISIVNKNLIPIQNLSKTKIIIN